MTAGDVRRRQLSDSSETSPLCRVRQGRGYDPYCSSAVPVDLAFQDVRDRMVKLLPRLRRFIASLTRGSDANEDLIQETYVRALGHLDQWQSGTRLDSWMFRIAQNLWIDHMRAERIRGNVVDIGLIDDVLSCDGRESSSKIGLLFKS